jgi:hypothetical protein
MQGIKNLRRAFLGRQHKTAGDVFGLSAISPYFNFTLASIHLLIFKRKSLQKGYNPPT